MSVNSFGSIMSICNDLMNTNFTIFGVNLTLYRIMFGSLVIYLVLWFVMKLFNRD